MRITYSRVRSPWLVPILTALALEAASAAQSVSPLPTAGKVVAQEKLGALSPGLFDTLDAGDRFGDSVAAIGDVDGDGIGDLAAGATGDDDAVNTGTIWLLLLESDGSVRAKRKISAVQAGMDPHTPYRSFGDAIASLGDLDGNGFIDLAVGAPGYPEYSGYGQGSVYILFLGTDGALVSSREIAPGMSGFQGQLPSDAHFGDALANLGDIDGDGVPELAVGASENNGGGTRRGSVWILFLNQDGSVRAEQQIGDEKGGLPAMANHSVFGSACAPLGDFDGDGIPDLAVGAPQADNVYLAGTQFGAAWLLFLRRDGTVREYERIDSAVAAPFVEEGERFGSALTPLGDLDGDGVLDLAIGADTDNSGCMFCTHGAVYVCFLHHDGSLQNAVRLGAVGQGGFSGVLRNAYRFGTSLACLGDLDGDGLMELAAGVPGDDDGHDPATAQPGSENRGAVWVLTLDATGFVRRQTKISDGSGGFQGTLDFHDLFGRGMAALGDFDGDGGDDLAVGAPGYLRTGSLWLLFYGPGGTLRSRQQLTPALGNLPEAIDFDDWFGWSVAKLSDLDGDGLSEVAVGAPYFDDSFLYPFGRDKGMVWILFLDRVGNTRSVQGIADGQGGFQSTLEDFSHFGAGVAGLQDLDGDGLGEIAVCAPDSVWILFPDRDGRIHAELEVTEGKAGLKGPVGASFGSSVASLGDLDGDRVQDIAVGASGDNDGEFHAGAVWVLFLNPDGTVKREQKISALQGGFSAKLEVDSRLGSSLVNLGDLDRDGVVDLAAGAYRDGVGKGAVWLLFLQRDGTVRAQRRIEEPQLGSNGVERYYPFASSLAVLGSPDGRLRLAVGTPGDDDGGLDQGAVWLLDLSAETARRPVALRRP